jgi:hypothetical protein
MIGVRYHKAENGILQNQRKIGVRLECQRKERVRLEYQRKEGVILEYCRIMTDVLLFHVIMKENIVRQYQRIKTDVPSVVEPEPQGVA